MPVWAGVGVSAGLGLYGAKKQSDASKQAAQTQTDASNQALGLQSQIYQQTRSDLSPYRNAGTSALGAEMGLLGLNPAAMGGGGMDQMQHISGVAGGAGPANGLTGPAGPYGSQGGAISDPSANGGYGGQVPGTGTLGSSGSAADNNSSYGPKSSPIPQLKVQAPDGTIYLVPANQAGDAQKNGGKVIGPV